MHENSNTQFFLKIEFLDTIWDFLTVWREHEIYNTWEKNWRDCKEIHDGLPLKKEQELVISRNHTDKEVNHKEGCKGKVQLE